jgi:hypothetical protein
MSATVGPEPQSVTARATPLSGRLNGWKEIASRLGRGVRTAQRWEKLHGLPVHRIGREGGEIVFAFTAELDRWARETSARGSGETSGPCAEPETEAEAPAAENTPPSPGHSTPHSPALRVSTRRRSLAALALGALALPALWAVRSPTGGLPLAVAAHAARIPVSWTLERRVLTVRGENGERLFEHALDFELRQTPSPARPGEAAPVEIADVDGDGRNEVLLAAPASDPAQRRFYCFEADGSLRFVHQPHGSVRFGDTEYTAPWAVEHVFLTRHVDGSSGLWVASSQPGRFPGWLQELAPDGGVRQDYHTDGRITSVSEARWAGRDVVFVGAADQDQDGASVAIFDRDAVAGSAPAARAGYDCTSCTLGGPREFIAFPRLCATSVGDSVAIDGVWVENGDGVTVATGHRRDARAGPGTPDQLLAFYRFDRNLDLVHAEVSREYQVAHDSLWRQGLLDHSYSHADDARLFPVRRFDGRRFVTLPAVGVGH